jgi:hypothetical protein
MICTDCLGSRKSNYHTITTTTAPCTSLGVSVLYHHFLSHYRCFISYNTSYVYCNVNIIFSFPVLYFDHLCSGSEFVDSVFSGTLFASITLYFTSTLSIYYCFCIANVRSSDQKHDTFCFYHFT